MKEEKLQDLYGISLKELYEINQKNIVEYKRNLDKCPSFHPRILYELMKSSQRITKFWNEYDMYYRNSKEYIEAYSYYKIMLEELSYLIKSVDWDNEMKLFAGYCYLYKQGYLSFSHQFYYSRYAEDCIFLEGNNILLGIGCCRHINSMLKDLLRECGYSSFNLEMLLDYRVVHLNDMKKLRLDEVQELSQEELENEQLEIKKQPRLWPILKKTISTNHLVTLFQDDTHSYIMDATNDTIYYVTDDLKVYQGGHEFKVQFDKLWNDGEELRLRNFLKPSLRPILEKRLQDYHETWEECFELTDTFERFYQEHKELYEEVVEKRKVLKREYDQYWIFNK